MRTYYIVSIDWSEQDKDYCSPPSLDEPLAKACGYHGTPFFFDTPDEARDWANTEYVGGLKYNIFEVEVANSHWSSEIVPKEKA